MEEQVATAGSQTRQLVVFALAGETYGVDIYQVREIIRVPDVTKVPKTPDFIEGIINLRGGVIPVLDLRRRLGMDSRDVSREARIVIVELADELIGMRVDGVSEVLRIEAQQIEPPSPYIINIDSQFVSGIARLNERLIILLDLNMLLRSEDRAELRKAAETAAQAPSGMAAS